MLTSRFVRSFSNARFALPPIKGEPFLHYAPGSHERALLEAALKKTKSEGELLSESLLSLTICLNLVHFDAVVKIPCVVEGKEYFTGETVSQYMPTNHQHKLAECSMADAKLMDLAISVSQKARAKWASTYGFHRSVKFSSL